MSLLRKASIVTTPTAYENGKILSVKPNTSVGDFDFTRNSSATRVNSQGLIEDMQTFSGNLVSNGDFSQFGQDWDFFGEAELTAQGARIYSSSGSYSAVNQSNVLTIGNKYKITFNVISTNGTNLANNGSTITYDTSTTGNKTFYITASEAVLSFKRAAAITTDVTITNISVIEITDDTNLPRIDYTGGVGHWLFEPQSTNLITYSEDFSQNTWIKIDVSLESGYLAPDGTNNAYKITSTSTSSHLYATGDYTQIRHKSIYARTLSGTGTISLCNRNSDPNALFTITEQWQRFDISHSDQDLFYAVDFRASGATLSEVIIWGAQLEQQSFATSIIPTNGSTVTRLADAAFGAGSSDLINSTEGVLYAEIAALASSVPLQRIALSDGTDDNRVYIQNSSINNQIFVSVESGGVSSVNKSTTAYDTTQFNKIAISYKTNNFSFWVNGTKIATDTSVVTPIGLNELAFDDGNGGLKFFSKTKCVAVFKEALTDTELTCLTTI